jgi:hypothetical protein
MKQTTKKETQMSRFSLANYKKKSEDDGIEKLPDWLDSASDIQKKVYRQVCVAKQYIEGRINNGDKLGINQRRIVVSRIANELGIDNSYITERRMKKVVDFIEGVNDELSRLWLAKTPSSNAKKRKKNELASEISKYKKELVRQKSTDFEKALTEGAKVLFAESNKGLMAEINELKIRLSEEKERSANLAAVNRQLTRELNRKR